jgi:hypothetical protein
MVAGRSTFVHTVNDNMGNLNKRKLNAKKSIEGLRISVILDLV